MEQPTDNRTVNYASLSPGNYRFLARAITTDGVVSLRPATLSFEYSRHSGDAGGFWLWLSHSWGC